MCLGVLKYIMQLQLSEGNKDKVFYIGSNKPSLSHRLLSIKPLDIVGRLPRSLDDLKHWKATELKYWLLYYSVAVLRNILRANVAKNQTFSKYCGNSSKINPAHILMLGRP